MKKVRMIRALATALVLVSILTTFAFADEAAKKPFKGLRVLDGIIFEPDGKYSWIDAYVNEVRRPEMYLWLDQDSFGKYARSIRYEANFLIFGAGSSQREVETRVRNKEGTDDFFRRAFSTEIECIKKDRKGREVYKDGKPVMECEQISVGNPNDYIILVVRKIPDSPNRNTVYLFTYIEKEIAHKLGCRDIDVVEYVDKKKH